MLRDYTKFFIRLGIALAIFFILANLIDNRYIILGIFAGLALIFIIIGLLSTKNHSGYLEIVLKPYMHYERIEKLKDHKDVYNLLKAYGLYYEGNTEQAKQLFAQVSYQEVSNNKRLDLTYRIVQLGILFEENDVEEYKRVYNKALTDTIFLKNKMNKDIFKVKEYILEEKYEEAIELAVIIIPKTQPRLFIVELEYYLARAYFELNRLDDCNAVCEFIHERDYQVKYTELCRQYLVQMNRTIY